MAWSGHRMVDPSEIETRFSLEDGMAYMASIFTEPSKEAKEKIIKVLAIMDDLPPMEADFIDLYFFRGFNQTDIAAIFGCSQPTVCYRLKRAAARIQLLSRMPQANLDLLDDILCDLLDDRLDIQIMRLMQETNCQSEVAKRLGVSQGLVRHRFIRSVNRMRRIPELAPFVRLFDFISANLNVLREVQRPAEDQAVTHVLD